jgi:hypothetical protein
MPLKSVVMAFVLSGWLIAAIFAFMIVAYAGFFGVAFVGVLIWFLSARVDQDRDGAVGAGVTPGFLARQFRARAEMSDAERRALRSEHSLEARSTRLFRYLGMAMTLIGLGGFWFYQL